MFTATFYFLGLAACILAASVCLTRGRHAAQCVELELADLRVASLCLLTTGDKKPTWQSIRSTWTHWYARCQQKAILKQKAMYSWARTLALCAVLCLVGVLLETQYDKPITVAGIFAGFAGSHPVAACVETDAGQNALRH